MIKLATAKCARLGIKWASFLLVAQTSPNQSDDFMGTHRWVQHVKTYSTRTKQVIRDRKPDFWYDTLAKLAEK